MRKSVVLLIGLAILLQGCMYAIRYDGTYMGKIVDEVTREPIEGVVVLGVWYKEAPTVAGAVSSYYDARETVTNKNGDFEISGHGLRIMTNLAPVTIMVFKAGHTYEQGQWNTLDQGYTLGKKIRWDGKKPIIPLKKLTMEERKKNTTPSPPHEASLSKIINMLREINKNAIELGFEPLTIWRGEKL